MSGALDDLCDTLNEAELVVRDPRTDEPVIGSDRKPWTIMLAGPLHEHTKAFEKSRRVEAMKAARGGRGLKGAVDEDFQIKEFVARTIGWSPITFKGEPLTFTPEAARDLYERSPAIKGQVAVFLMEAESFAQAVDALCEFEAHDLRIGATAPGSDESEGAHLRALARRGNRRAATELVRPPFPEPLRFLWNLFLEMSPLRESAFTVSAIRPTEIEAFLRLAELELAPKEFRIIRRLDDVFVVSANTKSGPKQGQNKQPQQQHPET